MTTLFVLFYTLTIDGRMVTSNMDFTSLSECLREKDRIETYYAQLEANDKSLEIRCGHWLW